MYALLENDKERIVSGVWVKCVCLLDVSCNVSICLFDKLISAWLSSNCLHIGHSHIYWPSQSASKVD